MATTSSSKSDADWAKFQLVYAFETKYQYDLAAFDQYISGLMVSLDLNLFSSSRGTKFSSSSKVSNAAKATQVGIIGELRLDELVGGKPNVKFDTTLGRRFVDQLSDQIAYESKVGYVAYSSKTILQIRKDAELIQGGSVKRATWYFFRSPNTGKIGADQRILDLLTNNNIKYIIYDK